MDTITQGLLGAAVAQVCCAKTLGGRAWRVGLVAGMFADLDTLFCFSTNSLKFLESYHHFTHSLLFIPIGALLVTLLFSIDKSYRKLFGCVFVAALVGYASHGLLDIMTSYGTVLFWPVYTERISLDNISIVDPVFTVILLVGVFWSAQRKMLPPALIALLLCVMYLHFGAVQHARAQLVQKFIAVNRGHVIDRGRVMPTLGNLVLWRSVYEYNGKIYSDAIRTPVYESSVFRSGEDVPKTTLYSLQLKHNLTKEQIHDFERFAWFADKYIGQVTFLYNVFGDMRYSRSVELMEPLWGIQIDFSKDPKPTRWHYFWSDSKSTRVKRMINDLEGRGDWISIRPKA
ncbi:MAG: metal-dependent hydrolase [bacterium]